MKPFPPRSDPDAKHVAPDLASRRRSLLWALFFGDAMNLRFWMGAIFGVLFFVAGIVSSTSWLLIFGPLLALASIGLLMLSCRIRL